MDPIDGIGIERLNQNSNDLHLMWPANQRGLDAMLSSSPMSGPHKDTEGKPITGNGDDINLVFEKKNRIVKYYLPIFTPCPNIPNP